MLKAAPPCSNRTAPPAGLCAHNRCTFTSVIFLLSGRPGVTKPRSINSVSITNKRLILTPTVYGKKTKDECKSKLSLQRLSEDSQGLKVEAGKTVLRPYVSQIGVNQQQKIETGDQISPHSAPPTPHPTPTCLFPEISIVFTCLTKISVLQLNCIYHMLLFPKSKTRGPFKWTAKRGRFSVLTGHTNFLALFHPSSLQEPLPALALPPAVGCRAQAACPLC